MDPRSPRIRIVVSAIGITGDTGEGNDDTDDFFFFFSFFYTPPFPLPRRRSFASYQAIAIIRMLS